MDKKILVIIVGPSSIKYTWSADGWEVHSIYFSNANLIQTDIYDKFMTKILLSLTKRKNRCRVKLSISCFNQTYPFLGLLGYNKICNLSQRVCEEISIKEKWNKLWIQILETKKSTVFRQNQRFQSMFSTKL